MAQCFRSPEVCIPPISLSLGGLLIVRVQEVERAQPMTEEGA